MALLKTIIGVSIASGLAFACSSSDDGDEGSDGNPLGNSDAFQTAGGIDQGSTSAGDGNSSGTTSGATGGIDSNVDGCADPNLEGCVGSNYEGEGLPLAIYIMFDQSASMDCVIEAQQPWQSDQCNGSNPRITPVREAVESFLNDRASAGISVGIGYFGYLPIGQTSCDPADYSQAAVPIGMLPDNAGMLTGSLNAVQPTGETPTDSAIRGACSYLQGWHEEHPAYKKVILLVTDGVPEAPSSEGCSPSIEEAVDATTECRDSDARIDTYVLGVGQALDNLNQIAQAGGTEQAYIVDGGNVSQSVLTALNAIRADAAIPCTLPVPTPQGGVIDYSSVNIGICDPAENSVTTFFVDNEAGCTNDPGGWYYTEGGSTRNIQLCDSTCGVVSSAGSTLYFTLGCGTITVEDIE
jgi:hypothetical protein